MSRVTRMDLYLPVRKYLPFYIYVCARHTHTHTHTHTNTHTHTHTRSKRIRTRTHAHTRTYTHTHAHTHVRMHLPEVSECPPCPYSAWRWWHCCARAHLQTRTRTHTRARARIHTHTNTHTPSKRHYYMFSIFLPSQCMGRVARLRLLHVVVHELPYSRHCCLAKHGAEYL